MPELPPNIQFVDDGPPILLVTGDLKGRLTPDAAANHVRNEWAEQREEILQLPKDDDGINMERVWQYGAQLCERQTPVLILSTTEYAKAKSVAGYESGVDEDPEDGKYLYKHDLVIIHRDPVLEQLNGPEYFESLAVHEIAHAGETHTRHLLDVDVKRSRLKWLGKTSANIEGSTLRVGFVVAHGESQEGYSLEEGYAEYERGQYVANVLGRPQGFTDGSQATGTVLDKYMYRAVYPDGDGTPSGALMQGAVAACAIELLSQADPKIVEAFRDGRKTVDGLREVARRIDAAEPGLYSSFRAVNIRTDEGQAEVRKILLHIRELVR